MDQEGAIIRAKELNIEAQCMIETVAFKQWYSSAILDVVSNVDNVE